MLTQSGGTLDGVTVDGSLDGTQVNDAYAYVTDGLTLNGTAYLGDASGATYGGLYATNTETLSGTGTVVFGKNASNFLDASDPAVTLTIGSGITIRGSSGTIGGFYSNDTIINQGTISADDSGGLVGPFSYDTDFSGGSTEITGVSIDTSGVTDPAPQAVYQTERQGSFTYTLPGLTPGGSYAVQLDFADIDFAAAGQQQFNVDINGTQVLSNFDVFSAAGGQYKAVAETFTATADGNGQITISFNYGNSGFPTVNGVELFSGGTRDPGDQCRTPGRRHDHGQSSNLHRRRNAAGHQRRNVGRLKPHERHWFNNHRGRGHVRPFRCLDECGRRVDHGYRGHIELGGSVVELDQCLVERRHDHGQQHDGEPRRRLHLGRPGDVQPNGRHRQSGWHAEQHGDNAGLGVHDGLMEPGWRDNHGRYADGSRWCGASAHTIWRDAGWGDGGRQSGRDTGQRCLRLRDGWSDAQWHGLSWRCLGGDVRGPVRHEHRDSVGDGNGCLR